MRILPQSGLRNPCKNFDILPAMAERENSAFRLYTFVPRARAPLGVYDEPREEGAVHRFLHHRDFYDLHDLPPL